MAYSKSRALVQFESTVYDLLIKCDKCKDYKIAYDLRVLIFQGAILLTCSSLENYLKSLIDDWVFQLKSQKALMKQLPSKTRKIIYLRGQSTLFKSLNFSGNENDAASKMSFGDFAFVLANDDVELPKYIKGVHIYGNKKYPSIDNIKKMFSVLEMENIFKIMSVKHRKDYSLDLESFLGMREALAHEFPPNVTYKDAKRHLTKIRIVVKKIDSIVHSHLAKVSGVEYWPA